MTQPTIEQLEDSCQGFLQEASCSPKPIIAAWGLVKAGKSSLLNMLSGHIEDEFFKTGVVRTTRLNQQLETEHYEPPRKSRRLFGLSHAARADSSSSCR